MIDNNNHKAYKDADKLYNCGKFKKAFLLFKKLAKQGDESAMDRVGSMYADGLGVKKDITKAIKWYKKAILKGGTTSLYNLGMVYKELNDVQKAKKWFKRSLKKDPPDAAVELAKLYLHNDSNPKKAISCLKKVVKDKDMATPAAAEEAKTLLKKIRAKKI